MKILYVEPFSGVAGDMFLSALCGLADAYDTIEALPDKLHLPDGKVEVGEVEKNGIVCRHVNVLDLNPEKAHHHAHDHHGGPTTMAKRGTTTMVTPTTIPTAAT